jgi:hypothetical protein
MTRRGRSGQILAVSALVIALIMISTATYIYDLSGSIGDGEAYLLNDYVRSIMLNSKHAIISALANITDGGSGETLVANLNTWSTAVEKQYELGTLTLNYTLKSTPPYVSGLYINWGTDGNGVSEAYADFRLNASGKELKLQYPFYVNVSARLKVEGYLTQVSPLSQQVTVVCRLFNEEQPALARNVTIYYRELIGVWTVSGVANNYTLVDYGNGTYRATFTVDTLATSLDVSTRVFDGRDILVQANATLTQQ